MTSYAALWVRCPKCFYSNLVSTELIDLNDVYQFCHKCNLNISEETRKKMENFRLFMKIFHEIYTLQTDEIQKKMWILQDTYFEEVMK